MNRTPKYILFTAVLTLLLAGCSSNLWKQRGAAKMEVTVTTTEGERPGDAPAARGERARGWEDRNVPSRRETPQAAPQAIKSPAVVRPQINFTYSESQHVRILAGYDPLPDSSQVTVDLAELSREFRYPYDGKFLSPYGMRGRSMHTGIDIKCLPNDTIRAAFPGVVRMSKLYSSYGNVVVIRHYNGIETVYAHNSKNLVKVNDAVDDGTPIALAGRTGRATTEHLHFEIRVANQPVDPAIFLDPENRRLRDGEVYLAKSGSGVTVSNSVAPGVLLSSLSNEIPEASVEPETKATQPAAQYHTIRSGETLSHLARDYSTTVARICALNGIQANKILRIGEKIRVK